MRAAFTCDRTCPRFERVDVCRFMPVLEALGTGVVNSHTTKLNVHIRSKPALAAAALDLGGMVLGEGVHALYGANREAGFAVKLPGWRFPIVLRESGELAFDTYGGIAADVPRLTRAYVLAAAQEAAAESGWMVTDVTPESVTILHPSGGRLTVKADGTCDAVGFCGTDCHASAPIEAAIGTVAERSHKPEYFDAGAGQMLTR